MLKMKSKPMLLSLVLLLLLSGIPIAAADSGTGDTTYYIDDLNGSDANDGLSVDQAWKTLDKVNATTFMPGDRILFKAGGKWTGSLSPKGSGTEGKSIVIGKYGEGNRPLIEGKGLVENAVYLYNQQYWEIGHLEITNKGAAPATSPRRGVLVSGEDFEKGSVTNIADTKTLRGIYIHDLYVHDVNGEDKKDVNGSSGIQVSVKIAGLVNGVPAAGSVHQRTTFDDVRIMNNEIRDVSRSGIMIWNDWKNRPLLGDGLDYGESALTPWTPVTNVVIRGNKLYNIGGDGIVPHMTDGALVEYNFLDGYNRTSTGYNAGMWTWDGDNTLYQFNEVTGGYSTRDGQPFDFDHATQGIIYQYNYTYNNDGGTLLVCADGRGGKVKDGIYRYNISQNDKYQTFTICGGSNVENVKVYNNVFYVKAGMNTNMLVSQGGGVDVSLFNNIFINHGTGRYTAKPTWKYHNNAFFGNNVPTKEQIPDPFMLTGDPKLVDPGKAGTVLNKTGPIVPDQVSWAELDGYKLSADSPMINAGRFIGVTHNPGSRDNYGNPIYNGMPDVGVHEYEAVQYPHVDPFEPVIPKPQAVVRNGNFENTAQHANSNPWQWQWNAGIINDGHAHGGSFAGYIKEVSGGASIEQQIAVAPDTTYRLSAYAKSGGADQKLYLGVKWTDSSTGNKSVQIPVESVEYALYELEFTTGSGTSGVTLYFWKDTGSAKKSYIDDVSIAEVVPAEAPSTSLSGPAAVESGKPFTVKLGLKNIAEEAYAQDIRISYDVIAMEFMSAQSAQDGLSIVEARNSDGTLRLIIASEGAGHGAKGTLDVAELTFKAKSVSQETVGTIAVTDATLGGDEGNETKAETSSVSVKVAAEPAGIPGDANNDGKISVGDLAIAAANYGKTSQSADWNRIKIADMDDNGVIDIFDLAAIANQIVS
ncbi:cohesin domain-containing protein [Paenibacillus sp. LHD-117]|uniref:cohesin domain-containing protein n=1 Tax=Paenibacillus sp. LHD-117 TaxID=3071412 RepID=UPI0027E0DAAF|nr:cohesin domain-containing protein [Paenibacillus sp. LHD-117]MDQ6423281.1 cohesin domain-containing protein [Paenibacillus sp. LHD-117]